MKKTYTLIKISQESSILMKFMMAPDKWFSHYYFKKGKSLVQLIYLGLGSRYYLKMSFPLVRVEGGARECDKRSQLFRFFTLLAPHINLFIYYYAILFYFNFTIFKFIY